ncbi:MAG: hypothetical protein ACTHOP_08025 [Mesorhizobium sp.]
MEFRDWISAASFGAACVALWLNFKTRRDYRLNLEPVISLRQTEALGSEIAISLRSVSNIGVRVARIIVLWPITGRMGSRDDMVALGDNRMGYVWKRSVYPKLSVAHAGTSGAAQRDTGEAKVMFTPHSRVFYKLAVKRWEATRWLTKRQSPSIRAHFFIAMEDERGRMKYRYRTLRVKMAAPAHG